jgi:hypothetical protein
MVDSCNGVQGPKLKKSERNYRGGETVLIGKRIYVPMGCRSPQEVNNCRSRVSCIHFVPTLLLIRSKEIITKDRAFLCS